MELTKEQIAEIASQAAQSVVEQNIKVDRKATPSEPEGKITFPESEKFKSLGEQLMAIARHETHGQLDNRLKVPSGLSENVPADGGFLVQQDFIQELLKKTYETGILASRCRRIGVGPNSNSIALPYVDESSRATGSRYGGVRAYWEAEGGTKTASQPKFGRIDMKVQKLIGLCYATDELLQDAFALEGFIGQAFAEEFGFLVDDAIVNGTGAGQPLGILNANCLVTVNKETGQAATTVVSENIDKMWSRMWSKSRGNAVWLVNQDLEPELQNMFRPVGTGGIPAYMPAGGLSASPYASLKGRSVVPIEQCQTLGTSGDILLVDMSQYLIIDKSAMQSATSIHVKFTTDETAFRFVYRVNGQPWWRTALTPYKGTNTLSPFVALQTRS